MTDLTAECDTLEIDGLENCTAHKGILQAAKFVLSTIDREHILEQAFERAEVSVKLAQMTSDMEQALKRLLSKLYLLLYMLFLIASYWQKLLRSYISVCELETVLILFTFV